MRAVEVATGVAATAGAELIALAVIDPGRFGRADVQALARSEGIAR